MSDDLKSRLEAALARLPGPQGMLSLTPAGAATLAIEINPAQAAALEPHRARLEEAMRAVPGVTGARAVLTAHSTTPSAPKAPAPPPPPPPNLRGPKQTHDGRAGPGAAPLPNAADTGPIPGVKRIIVVGSGKGGVGKSTVSANLALALAAEGWRVGILDADIYGPSQPRLMGLTGRPTTDGQSIEPLRAYGLRVMSMGFLIRENESVVWRGPMLITAINQMLRQTNWGELDALIVDLPPGTGDVQLTLSQKAEITGAVIVSTPQDLALLDARKAIDMFGKLKTPILGVIENMASFCCPKCGHETHIFGSEGARKEAERIGAPFLGAIPLELETRISSDEGAPIVAARPQSEQAKRFRAVARDLMSRLHAG